MMITEIFVSLFLVWFIWKVIMTYMKTRRMPPGPFPYPFLGNLPQLILANSVQPFAKLAEIYGDIYTVILPAGCAVIVNSASLIREARLSGKQEDLAGKLSELIYPWYEMIGEDLVTCDYSAAYRFRKKVFVSAMHLFGAGIERASTRALHAVNVAIEDIEKMEHRSFSPKKLFESSILVQLWEWLTSKKVALNDPIVKELGEIGYLLSKQILTVTIYHQFPFLRYLPTAHSRDIKRSQEIKNTVFPPEYQAHQESYTPGVVRDLTDSFINAYEKEHAKQNSKDIGSNDVIPGLMLDVAIGGAETTSTSLAWLFLYLVLHPDVQEKIHNELDVVVGRDRIPCWEDAQRMPYLQATLCEVQRASGFIAVIGTNAIRDTMIAGYHIPKGTFVALNLSKVHHDEREWPDPEKFKPERFLNLDGSFAGWSKLNGFLPFGIGRRECPGQSLAKIMMFLFASVLLHRYKIEVLEGAEIPTTEVSTPQQIIRPNDFQVVAKPRL